MKLVTFQTGSGRRISLGEPRFGLVIDGRAVSFAALQRRAGKSCPELADVYAYLKGLPGSFEAARSFEEYGIRHLNSLPEGECDPVAKVRFLPPVPSPAALIDFGLSPRHLRNSAMTMLRHEYGSLVKAVAGPFLKMRLDRMSRSDALPYYKCNHNEIIGDGDTAGWPSYSSYLDIEPELGIVTGTAAQPIAGYLIYNDLSARDVQMPEMIGTGPSRSKDFSRSNGIGPWLVTPDEIADPLALEVNVKVGGRYSWKGSTSEYIRRPEEVVGHIRTIFMPLPGTVIGMGTVPDCTGLDHDLWLVPGDEVAVSFAGLGTLRQLIPALSGKLEHSRWKDRTELSAFYKN